MADKPKDQNKEHSPNWGGAREGTGPKPKYSIRRLVQVAFLSEDEYQAFLDQSTPRSRVEMVLYAAKD